MAVATAATGLGVGPSWAAPLCLALLVAAVRPRRHTREPAPEHPASKTAPTPVGPDPELVSLLQEIAHHSDDDVQRVQGALMDMRRRANQAGPHMWRTQPCVDPDEEPTLVV